MANYVFTFILQERKIDLKENLVIELEDKKKSIENERLTMELTGGKLFKVKILFDLRVHFITCVSHLC